MPASPQPVIPASVSIRTKSHWGATTKVSTAVIFTRYHGEQAGTIVALKPRAALTEEYPRLQGAAELNALLDAYDLRRHKGTERFFELWTNDPDFLTVGPSHRWDEPFRRLIATHLRLHGGGTSFALDNDYHVRDGRSSTASSPSRIRSPLLPRRRAASLRSRVVTMLPSRARISSRRSRRPARGSCTFLLEPGDP